ncbi:MAG: DUF4097 family beta strand repeat protein [Acidobacteria bacterium]|nr:DUF4097 family beta strand repeat protein [Acidobacteriota bacterium]
MPNNSVVSLFRQAAADAAKRLKSVELRDLRPTLDLPFGRGPLRRDEFFWRGRVAAGRTFEVKGIQGSIRVSPSEDEWIELMAIKSGRRNRPEEVDIRVLEHEGGVTVGALYPSEDPKRPNELLPGEAGRMKVRRNDVSVEFIVRLPEGVRFVARTVNGDVSAEGFAGAVEARTVNGAVKIRGARHARAATVNGSIEVSLIPAEGEDEVQLKTVNGDLRLDLPAETEAHVQAATVSGDVWLEFPLEGAETRSRKKVCGSIGQGAAGRRLLLKTTNGGIRIGRVRGDADRRNSGTTSAPEFRQGG